MMMDLRTLADKINFHNTISVICNHNYIGTFYKWDIPKHYWDCEVTDIDIEALDEIVVYIYD